MSRPGKTVVIVLLVACAAIFIAIVWTAIATDKPSKNSAPVSELARVGDHRHAALGVDACGEWLPPAPQFEQRANQAGVTAGIHSHGDGLIHLHPFASDEADDASVGRFMDYGGWKLSSVIIQLWVGIRLTVGDACSAGDQNPADVQWVVGQYGKPWPTKARSGDPADYRPKNADIVAIYFLPEGSPLPEPPNAQAALASIGDLGGAAVRQTPPN
jgi:hypothetical protein